MIAESITVSKAQARQDKKNAFLKELICEVGILMDENQEKDEVIEELKHQLKMLRATLA